MSMFLRQIQVQHMTRSVPIHNLKKILYIQRLLLFWNLLEYVIIIKLTIKNSLKDCFIKLHKRDTHVIAE